VAVHVGGIALREPLAVCVERVIQGRFADKPASSQATNPYLWPPPGSHPGTCARLRPGVLSRADPAQGADLTAPWSGPRYSTACYAALLFVSAEKLQNLRANMAGLCGSLVLDLPEQDAEEDDARVGAALRWLADYPRWFLILDNLDTPAAAGAAEELLARLQGGHVVLTGRLSQRSGSVESLELDVLASEDAAQFLLERTERGRRRLSLRDYMEKWRGHASGVEEWHDERVMKYPRSVAVTWQTTI
jgi:hypothetical protein